MSKNEVHLIVTEPWESLPLDVIDWSVNCDGI